MKWNGRKVGWWLVQEFKSLVSDRTRAAEEASRLSRIPRIPVPDSPRIPPVEVADDDVRDLFRLDARKLVGVPRLWDEVAV